MVITKIIAVLSMGAAVGLLYRIPRRLLLPSSLVGVLAWSVYYVAVSKQINIIFANFLASLAIGFAAELLARLLKKPTTVFTVPGFIPLVPGRDAYTAMLYMVKGENLQGVAMAVQTLLIAGSIAFGIFLSSTIYRLVVNYRMEGGCRHASGN